MIPLVSVEVDHRGSLSTRVQCYVIELVIESRVIILDLRLYDYANILYLYSPVRSFIDQNITCV